MEITDDILTAPLVIPSEEVSLEKLPPGGRSEVMMSVDVTPTTKKLLKKEEARSVSSSSSSSSSKKRRRSFISKSIHDFKRVHFNMTPSVISFSAEQEEEDNLNRWYTPDQTAEFKKRAKRNASVFFQVVGYGDAQKHLENFEIALSMCSDTTVDRLENVPLVSNSPVRGLENYLFPQLNKRRRCLVRGIVRSQKRFPEGLEADQKVKLLAATSKKLTLPSRRLARVLGIGDANVSSSLQEGFNATL